MKIGIVIEKPSSSAVREGRMLSSFEQNFIAEKSRRCGLLPNQVQMMTADALIADLDGYVLMGELPLNLITNKKGIDKWHLSPVDGPDGFHRCVPTYDFRRLWADWPLTLYFEMSLRRIVQNASVERWVRKEERYALITDIDEGIARLEALLQLEPEWYSIDIETGRNQINTFGVSWTGNDAIAIKCLPDHAPNAFFRLWSLISRICRSPVPKVCQNGIYERTYLSRYGIPLEAFLHDTMVAQKFLWPELTKGLDNVGRIYTMEPYWKDDGRVASEEGKQKDWGDIRDWNRHLTYNCRDTSNTLVAMHAQRAELKARGMLELYDGYLVKLFDCVAEMGIRGLPLAEAQQAALVAEYEKKSADLTAALSQKINPRSWRDKQKLLKAKGYELPRKRKTEKESTDELSLKKLRLKHPEDADLQRLLEIAKLDKALSSYLRVRTLEDKKIRFMLDVHGTETGRMSCSNDPWGGGFNAQTMSDYVKGMIEWKPEEDRVFLEFDLEQAETRFVAYDACEETLLGMLEKKQDVHRYVAAEIYNKPMCDVTHDERQLGKKSGHGANYNMGVTTFQDSCLKEMDLVLDRAMASRVLESYHRLFPGIKRWHGKLRETVYRERRLTNPFGRVRYFYGRTDDSAYREAYAYRPQSTVPDVTNHLMLGLRDNHRSDIWLHLQVHDSVVLSCRTAEKERIMRYGLSLKWHPEIILPAGKLVIPTSAKWGHCLGSMEKWTM